MTNKWNYIGNLKPEPDETYLVAIAENCNGEPMVTMLYYEGNAKWISLIDGGITKFEVTHWMSKPELPEALKAI